MSDKELIETIERMKEYCTKRDSCTYCSFFINGNSCQFELLARILADCPSEWNIERIKGVICK